MGPTYDVNIIINMPIIMIFFVRACTWGISWTPPTIRQCSQGGKHACIVTHGSVAGTLPTPSRYCIRFGSGMPGGGMSIIFGSS